MNGTNDKISKINHRNNPSSFNAFNENLNGETRQRNAIANYCYDIESNDYNYSYIHSKTIQPTPREIPFYFKNRLLGLMLILVPLYLICLFIIALRYAYNSTNK